MEQPWSLTGGEAENEPQGEFGLAKDNTSAWQGIATTQRLHYCPEIPNFIFLSFNCQLGLCSKPACLGWVQKIWTAHENLSLFKLKSLAAFTGVTTDWCQFHRESSCAKMTSAQTDDARLTRQKKSTCPIPDFPSRFWLQRHFLINSFLQGPSTAHTLSVMLQLVYLGL